MPVWKAGVPVFAVALALAAPAGSLRAEPYPPDLVWQPADDLALQREIDCLALNIYFEARSESRLGKLAVAAVTLNRVSAPAFPDSVCEVVNQGEERGRHLCQFSWRCDGLTDTPANVAAWLDARAVAQQALGRPLADPTGGALWYHADHVMPEWAKVMRVQARIGRHLFYGEGRPLALDAGSSAEGAPSCARPAHCSGRGRLPVRAYHMQLLEAEPLAPARRHLAMAGFALPPAGLAGRIRLSAFERTGAAARRYLALANALDAKTTLTLADLATPAALTRPAPTR